MKVNSLFLIGLLCSIIFLVSCREQQTSNQPDVSDPNIVTLQQAKTLVSEIGYTTKTKSGEIEPVFTDVENVVAYNDLNGAPNFYVTNYKNGNFLILSADKRLNPVLAYSTGGSFDNNIVNRPEGVQEWMNSVSAHVASLRSGGTKSSIVNDSQWTPEAISRILGDIDEMQPVDPRPCKRCGWPVEVSDIIGISWGQKDGFNDECPYLACTYKPRVHENGRALAGCGAVAVAQIIYHHKKPASYNWASMSKTAGGGDTPRLIHNVGIAISSDYDCGGTASSTANIRNTFIQYGYSNIQSKAFSKFDLYDLMTEIDNNRPIFVSGKDPVNGGHGWVICGYHFWPNCFDCGGPQLYAYMNWGWQSKFENSNYNGYYQYDGSWSVRDYSFSADRNILYNIY